MSRLCCYALSLIKNYLPVRYRYHVLVENAVRQTLPQALSTGKLIVVNDVVIGMKELSALGSASL
jgi:hypothetical protein